jgi:hypothetical protein
MAVPQHERDSDDWSKLCQCALGLAGAAADARIRAAGRRSAPSIDTAAGKANAAHTQHTVADSGQLCAAVHQRTVRTTCEASVCQRCRPLHGSSRTVVLVRAELRAVGCGLRWIVRQHSRSASGCDGVSALRPLLVQLLSSVHMLLASCAFSVGADSAVLMRHVDAADAVTIRNQSMLYVVLHVAADAEYKPNRQVQRRAIFCAAYPVGNGLGLVRSARIPLITSRMSCVCASHTGMLTKLQNCNGEQTKYARHDATCDATACGMRCNLRQYAKHGATCGATLLSLSWLRCSSTYRSRQKLWRNSCAISTAWLGPAAACTCPRSMHRSQNGR